MGPRNLLVALLGTILLTTSIGARPVRNSSESVNRIPVGIVEGFYGRPWSHEDRISMIRFLGEHGFDQYCYAPKDDPYHRKKWREPYPPADFAKLTELVRACQKYRVTFVFAISPGLDIEYGSAQEFDLLMEKLRRVHEVGVHAFALFFDDVPSSFPHASDLKRFASFAAAHADLANRMYAKLKEWNPQNSLVVCPTEYYHPDSTPYLRELGETLHAEIPIVWTGMGVTSQFITPEDLLRIRASIKRKPFLWDNYPVNDYDAGHLYLGPVRGRTPVLSLNLSGYWANPMNEAEASKIPLLTIADFFKSPDSFDPEESWRRAILTVGGKRAYPHLRTLADLLANSFLSGDEGRLLATLAADYLNAPTADNFASLNLYLDDLLKLDEQLARTLSNKSLYRDLKPSLKKLKRHASNLKVALAIDHLPTTVPEIDRLRRELRAGLEAVDTLDTSSEATKPTSATKEQWEALIFDEARLTKANAADQMFARIQQVLFSRDLRKRGVRAPVLITVPPAYRGHFAEYAFDENPETYYCSMSGWKNGETFAVDFETEYPASSQIEIVSMEVAGVGKAIRNASLEVSSNGVQWTTIGTVHSKEEQWVSATAFRCLRIVAKEDIRDQVVIREIRVRSLR